MNAAAVLLEAVGRHASRVLDLQRLEAGGAAGALFPEALDRATGRAAVWPAAEDGRPLVPGNPANQQNLFRALHGLSLLSGDPAPADAGRAALADFVARYQEPGGLFLWGSHRAVDLRSGSTFGLDTFHELKLHLPWYPGLWAVSPAATRAFVEAFWDAHVLDWSNLDMNRHGLFGRPPPAVSPWTRSGPSAPVFFVGKGLSFRNTGADLIHAAGELALLSGEEAPLRWAEILAERYVATRHPATGLPGYQYSEIAGDRARLQLGPELGDDVREHTILDRSRATRVFGNGVIAQLGLAESLGSRGSRLRDWAVQDLRAFVGAALDAGGRTVYSILRDGRILSPETVRRAGYYRPESFAPYPAPPLLLWSCARAWRLSHEPAIGVALDRLLSGAGCTGRWHGGDFAAGDGLSDPAHVLALAELYRDSPNASLADALLGVASALVRSREVDGLFLPSPAHRYARIGGIEPIALLHAVAALRRNAPPPPAAAPAEPFFTAPGFGRDRTSDYLEWYPQLLDAPGAAAADGG